MFIEQIHKLWPDATQLDLVAVSFGIYTFSILAFGVVYFLIFKCDDSQFFLAKEIVKSQLAARSKVTRQKLGVLSREISAMQEVLAANQQGALLLSAGTLPSGHIFKTDMYAMVLSPGQTQDRLKLRVEDAEGAVLCDVEGPQDMVLDHAYFVQWLEDMINTWEARTQKRQNNLARIIADPVQSFGFLDFLYFSCITQTTVGYGDILPNATSVRVAVMIQVLFGYAILVMFLNFVLIGGTPS